MTWSEWVKQKRSERGLTRRELANLIGMNQWTVGSWERGGTQPDVYAKNQLKNLFGELPDGKPDERP